MLETIVDAFETLLSFIDSIASFIGSIITNTITFVQAMTTSGVSFWQYLDYFPTFIVIALGPIISAQIVMRLLGR